MRLVADHKERLDKFLVRNFPEQSRSRLQKLVEDGQVKVEGQFPTKCGFELRPGWIVELDDVPESLPHDLEPANIPLVVHYEDDDLLVVDKPRGLPTHPASSHKGPTLVNALLARPHSLSTGSASYRPGIVHRLDKETTGLLLVAKSDLSHRRLSQQISEKTALRIYLAVALGEPPEREFTVDVPIGRHPMRPTLMSVVRSGRPAVTHFRALDTRDGLTWFACKLETGRTHQIRVHLAACHMPVMGDKLYATGPATMGAMQLHAALLRFTQPMTGETVTIVSEPPDDFLKGATIGEAILSGAWAL